MKNPAQPTASEQLTRHIRPTEFALIEGVSRRTVLNWIDAGIITPVYKIGKVIALDPAQCRDQLRAASALSTPSAR